MNRVMCALFAGILAVQAGCFVAGASHPTDAQLLDRFSLERATFESLLSMFREDRSLGRVAPDFTRPDDPATVGVSAQRVSEYRRLCKALGLQSGIEGYDGKSTIWFNASSTGLAVTGSGKGYAYVASAPDLVVPSLDAFEPPDAQSFTAYRHIEGNWYLYLEYTD